MKYLHFLIFFWGSICFATNGIVISPSTQSKTFDSGQVGSAWVDLYNNYNGYGVQTSVPAKITIQSNPDNGMSLNGIDNGQTVYVDSNQTERIHFNFFRNVSSTTTTTYKIKVEWNYQPNNGAPPIVDFITINVTYSYGTGPCNAQPPSVFFNELYTPFEAKISWNPVGGIGYQAVLGNQTPINLTNNTVTFANLTPNTTYSWRIRTKCSNGSYGSWSPAKYFTTPAECPEDLLLEDLITTNNEIKASGTITAKSAINPNLDVKFRAEEIVLKEGFSVKGQSTGVFRAYIDPCAQSFNKMESEEPFSEFTIKKDERIQPIISPNPTTTILNIDNIAEIQEWKLVDINGKTVESGKVNNSIQTKITVNTSRLMPGVYYFNAVMKNGELFQKTVMKK